MSAAHFQIEEGTNASASRRFAINTERLTIGRAGTCDLVLNDDRASRVHATLEHVSGKYYLRDLDSRNGTAVNGAKLRTVIELQSNDAVQIGRHVLTLVLNDSDLFEPDEMLTADDLVEVDDSAADAPSDEVLPSGLFSSTGDAASQLKTLAANLPDHSFEAADIILTDASGHNIHGSASKGQTTPGEAVELLRSLLLVGCRSHATDIHLEPRQDGHYLRLRIDGIMVDIANFPTVLGTKLATVVKVLCQIDIAQRKAIQEGAFAARVPDAREKEGFRRLDYRVSFAPAVMGQKLVVRILDAAGAPARINDLGLPAKMLEQLSKVVHRDSGMLLTAGPTGSGKTTTLYALLRSIDLARRNVVTIEDPVEVHLDGITQIPVDDSQDRSFLQLLRSVLRQDPDVILIGEVRDAETARTAMQAAITGHMVLSTVHTRDTIGTIFRLRDLGVEPYLLGQGLQLVIAQRLVRQLCPFCKRAVQGNSRQRDALAAQQITASTLYKPVGCGRCLGTGHAGRRAYFELLLNNEALAEAMNSTPTRQEVLRILGNDSFRSLRQSAFQLVADGLVSFDEVDRDLGTDA